MQTQYGPGDAATWGAPTGHPNDPRTEDFDDLDLVSSGSMALPICGTTQADVAYSEWDDGSVFVEAIHFSGGEKIDACRFHPDLVASLEDEVAAELRKERRIAYETARAARLEAA